MNLLRSLFAGGALALCLPAGAQDALYVTDPAAGAIYRVTPGQAASAPEIISATTPLGADAWLTLDDTRALLVNGERVLAFDRATGEAAVAFALPDAAEGALLARGLNADQAWLLVQVREPGAPLPTARLHAGTRDPGTGAWSFTETTSAGSRPDVSSASRLDVSPAGLIIKAPLAVFLPDGSQVDTSAVPISTPRVIGTTSDGGVLLYRTLGTTSAPILELWTLGPSGEVLSTQQTSEPSVLDSRTSGQPAPLNPRVIPDGESAYLLLSSRGLERSADPFFLVAGTEMLVPASQAPGFWLASDVRPLSNGDWVVATNNGVQRVPADGGAPVEDLRYQRGAGPALVDVLAIDATVDGVLHVLNGGASDMQVLRVDVATGDRELLLSWPRSAALRPRAGTTRSWGATHPFLRHAGETDNGPAFLVFHTDYFRKPFVIRAGDGAGADLTCTVLDAAGPVEGHPLNARANFDGRIPVDMIEQAGARQALFVQNASVPAVRALAGSETLSPIRGMVVEPTPTVPALTNNSAQWQFDVPPASWSGDGFQLELILPGYLPPSPPRLQVRLQPWTVVDGEANVLLEQTTSGTGFASDVVFYASGMRIGQSDTPRVCEEHRVVFEFPGASPAPGAWTVAQNDYTITTVAQPPTTIRFTDYLRPRATQIAPWGDSLVLLHEPGTLRFVFPASLAGTSQLAIDLEAAGLSPQNARTPADLLGDIDASTAYVSFVEGFGVAWIDAVTGAAGIVASERPAELAPGTFTLGSTGFSQMAIGAATPLAEPAAAGWMFR